MARSVLGISSLPCLLPSPPLPPYIGAAHRFSWVVPTPSTPSATVLRGHVLSPDLPLCGKRYISVCFYRAPYKGHWMGLEASLA